MEIMLKNFYFSAVFVWSSGMTCLHIWEKVFHSSQHTALFHFAALRSPVFFSYIFELQDSELLLRQYNIDYSLQTTEKTIHESRAIEPERTTTVSANNEVY